MAFLHFIKCYESSTSEEDWYRLLLGPLGMIEHSSPDFSVVENNAIYAILGSLGLRHVPLNFLNRLNETKGKGLLHVGDEFLAGGYELYHHFDFVLRNYYAGKLSADGIRTFPVGYPNGMSGLGWELEASQRPLAWSFLGNLNAARASMIAEFTHLQPHRLHVYNSRDGGQPVAAGEYKAVLRSSAFLPCPMGNVMLETWRVYEGLEAGAIPLVSKRLFMRYHDLVMPGHPIPSFGSWSAARRFAEELLKDRAALDALQACIGDWWKTYKTMISADLCDFVARGFQGGFRTSLARWRPPTGTKLQIWRRIELLKHHDVIAAKGRFYRELSKLTSRFFSARKPEHT
jgi:hypothetical protein